MTLERPRVPIAARSRWRRPDFQVRVNGLSLLDLAEGAGLRLRSLMVQEDLQALSMFTLELHNWNEKREAFWSDDPLFAVGKKVEIWLGYENDLHAVMHGEITSLELVFSTEQEHLLTVRGYDLGHRLARGRKTRTFTQMTDSAIASQIAREAGLSAHVDSTKVTQGYVIQSNQSDWEFLQSRAGLIGYEIYVRQKVLYFRRPRFRADPLEILHVRRFRDFSLRLRSLTQASEVAVRAWSVKDKKAVVGTKRARRGDSGGPTTALQAFGAASLAILGQPARSLAEADLIAEGRFDTMSLAYVEGDLVAPVGLPRLHAGTVVAIVGAGETFSGDYYVTSVTHTMNVRNQYHTSFSVQREYV